MEKSQITLTISLVMIALFSIAIISFTVGFANDNNAVVNIADDPELSSLNTETTSGLSTFKEGSEGTYTSILETTVEPGSDVVTSTGPFAITPGNIVNVIKNIIYLPYKKIFGSGSGFGIFFTTFIAILTFVVGLLIYKTLRGNP